MSLFRNPLKDLEQYSGLENRIGKAEGPVLVTGLPDAAKAHLVSELGGEKRPWRLLITYDDVRAREFFEDLSAFSDRVWLYPARDMLFYSADIRGFEVSKARIDVWRHMQEESGGLVVTTVDALMDELEEPERFRESVFRVSEADTLDPVKFAERLTEAGYERTAEVDGIGQFSVRGGIIDFFPVTEELPVRIELWDTDIDSIRSFDPESQRSVERLSGVSVYPAKERTLGGTASFLRYWDERKSVLFLDEPHRLRERAKSVEEEFRGSMAARLEAGQVSPEELPELFGAERILEELSTGITVLLSGLDAKPAGFPVKESISIEAKSAASFPGSFELLLGDMKRYQREMWRIVLMTPSRTRAGRLAENFREYGISAYCPDTADSPEASPGSVMIVTGNLGRGFEYPLLRFAVLTESDLFGRRQKKKKQRAKRYSEGDRISSLSELYVGDYVVHEEYGLGIYRGIEKIETEGVVRDYVKIEYRGGDNCYVPATKLDAIMKYAAGDAPAPKLNRLGGPEWTRTKTRVKGAVAQIAKELVTLYADRLNRTGYIYGPDTVWQKEFEEMFPYEETSDQLKAIEDVKSDMEHGRIMDRLICGDVGYGKTEIALRAAFKAVQEGFQVVFLVPTTILAQQHYNTFCQRMKDFPVRVDLLCRFRTAAQQKKTLNDFARGTVDIVIGTHRVLTKDLHPKKLGLLVIDEEQRFGVTHKEKLKNLKKDVNVLTLTATPIPRTLHMSLAGIRELSVLEEPPLERQPIQTYVMEYHDETVREAIRRELARGGQVYYVYNRVNTINDVAARLKAMLPDAEIAAAHGQMQERELEAIMLDFMNGSIDVLVSTTIIETGLDIPNVNTIIIQDADRLGLSQLYQLRGRVGRSSRTSYAFLMYRRDKLLSEEAEKRLKAIREFTELGSGIRIAMRDLEIRGAGNVLGAEQHGHMQAVGYDLYCKLLNKAVRVLSGKEKEEERTETGASVEAVADAYIPGSYIRSEEQKLDIYKRIASVVDEDDDLSIQDELMDRFGDIPKPVKNLLLIARIRAEASAFGASEVKVGLKEAKISMRDDASPDPSGLPEVIREYRGALTVRQSRPAIGRMPAEPVSFLLKEARPQIDGTHMLELTLHLLEKLRGSASETEKR